LQEVREILGVKRREWGANRIDDHMDKMDGVDLVEMVLKDSRDNNQLHRRTGYGCEGSWSRSPAAVGNVWRMVYSPGTPERQRVNRKVCSSSYV
jgi:hypothetical protein